MNRFLAKPGGGDGHIELAALTHGTRAVVRAIGLAHALAFMSAFGGTRIYVPYSASSKLVDAVGLAAAERFVAAFKGNTWIYVPKADRIVMLYRNQQILRDSDSGDSARIIALRYGLTVRQVLNIRRGRESSDARQQLLF